MCGCRMREGSAAIREKGSRHSGGGCGLENYTLKTIQVSINHGA